MKRSPVDASFPTLEYPTPPWLSTPNEKSAAATTAADMDISHPNAVANFVVEDAPWTTKHTNAPPIPYAAATVTATISRVANPAQNNKRRLRGTQNFFANHVPEYSYP